MGGWEYVLEFLCCFFALSDDDGWEKTTHELMVLYGDDEMVMPFNTHTHTNVSNCLCNGLSLSLFVLFSGGSLGFPGGAIQERARKRVAV